MPTKRGFVSRIEIGRAGLVTVSVVHENGSTGNYVIQDLDADPERFNERLSKLAILRDAQDRAEPVEIEYSAGDGGNLIDRAARISRDDLAPVTSVTTVAGIVVDLMVASENGVIASGEKHDAAKISVLTTALTPAVLQLDLQAPERLVVNEQLEMIRDAQARGRVARFIVQSDTKKIVAVAVDNHSDAFGHNHAAHVDGFVESLSLLRIPGLGLGSLASSFAHVRFTTAPPFTGSGNVVGLSPFAPQTIDLLVPRNSLAYDLFKAGLRDNLRMRANVVVLQRRETDDREEREEREPGTTAGGTAHHIALMRYMDAAEVTSYDPAKLPGEERRVGLAFACELLAHLASASRPVWIKISRESLDHGPDGFGCTEGVPSSDLTPRSLRDMRIPYPAVWKGYGCFNPGVYRFQLALATEFTMRVDGKEVCLYDSDTEGIKLAHACLDGCHEIVVEIADWKCEYDFVMDAYQLR